MHTNTQNKLSIIFITFSAKIIEQGWRKMGRYDYENIML